MGFSRQEYWNRLPFLSPGDLPDPGIKPASFASQVDSLPLSHQGSPRSGENPGFVKPETYIIWGLFSNNKKNKIINTKLGERQYLFIDRIIRKEIISYTF